LFFIIAYNIDEQEYLLDLSASQLEMRIVNFGEISFSPPCYIILRRKNMDFCCINEKYNRYLQRYEKAHRGITKEEFI